MSSSLLHLLVTLCAIHCAFADSYVDPKNVHIPEIVRGPEVTKLPTVSGDQPVSPTKKDAGIKLPNCSYLGRYAMRDNLRRRLFKGINLGKRNMVYDCELEGFATIPTAESFSGNSHTGMFDGTMMFFQAEKKSCYRPSHFIRDALRTWSNILQNLIMFVNMDDGRQQAYCCARENGPHTKNFFSNIYGEIYNESEKAVRLQLRLDIVSVPCCLLLGLAAVTFTYWTYFEV